MSKPRKPTGTSDDASDFASALGDVRPLGDRDKQVRPSAPRPRPKPGRSRDREHRADAFEHPDPSEPRLAHRASVSAARFAQLVRGALAVDRKLDLHGMRAEAARDALRRTLAACAKSGESVLLLIHGRGKHSGGFAVLRDELPEWLEAEDRVLAFCPASTGGDAAGATSILLKVGGKTR